MNWFYADGGQQRGPIDEAQLVEMIQSGKITQETLVWREGMANWLPLRLARAAVTPSVPPPSPVPAASPLPAPASVHGPSGNDVPPAGDAAGSVPPQAADDRATCAECGRSFAKPETVLYGTVCVCASCRPGFLDRVMGRASSVSDSPNTVSEEELLAREYKIDIGSCLERAWRLFTETPGTMIATAALVAGIIIVTSLVGNFLPGAQLIYSILIGGPMMAGYLWFLVRLGRKQTVSAGDAFAGFSKGLVQLCLVALVQTLASLACMFPAIALGGTAGLLAALERGDISGIAIGLLVGFGVAAFAGMAAVMYITTLWTHSLLLVIDKGYAFWPAMELSRKVVGKRWWMTFLFVIIAGIIGMLGSCVCFIGLIVTLPLQFAMKAFLYEDNFADLTPKDSGK